MQSTSLIPQRETLIESKSKTIKLNDLQLKQLRHLGVQLSGKSAYWGKPNGDDSETSVIEINPTNNQDTYAISVRNAIGTISLDNLVLDIEPKIPLNHFVYIANASKFLGRFAKGTLHYSGSNTFAEVFANHFVELVRKMTSESEYLDYKPLTSKLASPRGRILAVSTALGIRSGDVSIVCQHEEFSSDNILNRIIVKALRMITGDKNYSQTLRKNASALLNRFDVGIMEPRDLDRFFRDIPPKYSDIASLARAIIKNSYPIGHGLQQSGYSFLLPTPSIIESGLRNLIRSGFGNEWIVSPTAARKMLAPSKVSVNPDLLLKREGSSQTESRLVTGDVKYQIGDDNWKRSNLYQASTFATAFRASMGFVIAFTESPGNSSEKLIVGDIQLKLFSWKYGSHSDPDKSLETLILEMKMWLNSE